MSTNRLIGRRMAAMSLTVFMAAGSSALAQNRTSGRNETDPSQRERTAEKDPASSHRDAQSGSHRLVFVPGDSMKGKEVYNTGDEKLGTVNDLIIERGSGQIAYVVLETGTILGMGGKYVVAPYSAFGWDQMDKHVLLNSTPDAIKAWPEFDKQAWSGRGHPESALSRTLSNQYYKEWSSDKTYPTDKNLRDEKISGRVTNIVRQPTPKGPEELVVTVTDSDGRTRNVAVGPSWYLAGNSVQIYRGTPVDMRIISIDRDGRQTLVARSVSVNSRSIDLYDDNARPYWADTNRTTDRQGNRTATALILSDEIVGKKVDCRGEQCGEIDDIIVECTTGRVAFVSIDPDQNTLGIGDTNRLAPWPVVVGIRADRVLLDADKTMVVNARETPSDPKVLTDWYRDAYRSFDIQPAAFNWRDTGSGTMDSGLNDPNGSHRNPDQRHEKP